MLMLTEELWDLYCYLMFVIEVLFKMLICGSIKFNKILIIIIKIITLIIKIIAIIIIIISIRLKTIIT
jgi:hypothetical protein